MLWMVDSDVYIAPCLRKSSVQTRLFSKSSFQAPTESRPAAAAGSACMASESKWSLARQSTNVKMDVLGAFDQAARMSKFRKNAADSGVSGVHTQEELDEMLDARCGLRYHIAVSAELRRWTRVLASHQRALKITPPIGALAVDEATYKLVFYKVCLAMTTRTPPRELVKIVAEDWEHDSRGKTGISLEQFKDSLFERTPSPSNRIRTAPIFGGVEPAGPR